MHVALVPLSPFPLFQSLFESELKFTGWPRRRCIYWVIPKLACVSEPIALTQPNGTKPFVTEPPFSREDVVEKVAERISARTERQIDLRFAHVTCEEIVMDMRV